MEDTDIRQHAEDTDIRQLVADTGRILLERGLVARTWGNISCRKNREQFAISPSGLGYENMTAEDVPIYDFAKDTYEGKRKPSSEKKIHAAAYRLYPEVNFVVHTHQDYATAMSLVGTKEIKMTDEEKELLGTIEVADYGLPGTGRLKNNVEAALKKGSKVVLMIHHGAVILGCDRDEAIKKAELLENVCRRTIEEKIKMAENLAVSTTEYNNSQLITDDNILYCADRGGIPSQLDDIAQMLGTKLKAVENRSDIIEKALSKDKAVLVKGVGCIINAEDPDDVKTLEILIKKAALSYRFSQECNVNKKLSAFDCILMKAVYTKKYSKQKKG